MTEQQKNDAAPQSAQGDLHPENEAQERKGLKVPRTVWALGFVSLLMDISSEMIHALLPLFMAAFGASPPSGLCEVLSLMIRPRKPITT